ncbi:MAG: PAS domain-containing protein [Bacteroidota bacterium]|nr:PAS domain-containing protein [Bacteroidota bacterium]
MELQLSDLILENPKQMIALISKEGVFLHVNEMFCSVCGYRADELLGQNRKILASGYHEQSFFDDLWKTSDSGYIWKGEIKNKRKDGSFFWMDTTIIPLFTEAGELDRSLSISIDISEKKEREEKQQLQEWIIASIDDAIISKDLAGKITACNPGVEKIFGYNQEELLGKNISMLIPPELLMEEAQLIADIRAEKKVENYETERITRSGKRIQVAISLAPIKDTTGRLIGISKLVQDITLRKREEKILADSAEKYRNYFAKSRYPCLW